MLLNNLVALLGLLATSEAYFILSHPILETTRLDPIVNPGTVSSHVHAVVGGSNFDKTVTYNSTQASKCTTSPVTVDKSMYWTPQLYYYNPSDATFELIPCGGVNTYYLPRAGTDGKIQAFPDGLRMISGSPFRRTFDGTADSKAITFVCLDYGNSHQGDPDWAERNSFFTHNCPNGLRAQVFFRSCWDGVNLDSPDHLSHMAWPSGGVDGGECPASHPVRLVSLFYEFFYSVQNFPFNNASEPTWVFANGDTTGYGMHGDFINGWNSNVNGHNILQEAIDGCNDNNGVGGELQNCPPFVGLIDSAGANACTPENDLVNEDIGAGHYIKQLPGDNPIWIGNGSKPGYANYTEGANFTNVKSQIPDGYNDVGCIKEGSNGRALQGKSITGNNMTRGACVSFCQANGFPLSGVEYGRECYCGDLMSGGASNTTTVAAEQCNMKCAGNAYETCGGPGTMELYNNPSMYKSASLPSGWAAQGCYTEASSGRALSGYSFAQDNMTQAYCISVCGVKGFSMAGVEYSRECYCGNSLNSGSTQAANGECSMSCSGDAHSQCGGSSRLNVFKSTVPATGEWSSQGCYSEATQGRALTGLSSSSSTQTVESCLALCAAKGFAICGMEYSSECYGGMLFASGSAPAQASDCNMQCSGDKTETCGGPSRLSIYTRNVTVAPLPAGWSATGCRTEAQNGRTLNQYSFTSDSMTTELCLTTCQSKNYTIAGTEWSRECYCGSSFVGNSTSAPDSDCNMSCSGAGFSLCGGSKRLSTYVFNN